MERIDFPGLIKVTLPDSRLASGTLGGIITYLLPYIYRLAGFLLLALLVIGGYEIMTAQGDPKKVAVGNQRILYAVIGFIVMAAAFVIVQVVGNILNIQQLKDIFG